MRYRLLSLLIICIIRLSAQEKFKEIDSILDRAWEHHTKIELLPALEDSKKALTMAKKQKYDKGVGEAYFMAADALLNIGLHKEALNYLEEIKKTSFYKTRPIIQSEIHRVRSRAYLKLKLYELAKQELHAQTALIDKLEGKQKTMSRIYQYGNLATVFKKTNNLDSLDQYCYLQLELLEQLDKNEIFFSYMNVYNDLGQLFIKKKDYQKAEYYLNQSLGIIDKFDVKAFFTTMNFYGELEGKKGNRQKALDYYNIATDNIRDVGDQDALRDQYKFMAEFYRDTLRDNELASRYLLHYTQLNDSLETKNRLVIDVALNQILQNNQLERASEIVKYRRYFLIGIVLLIGFFLLYLFLARRNRLHTLVEQEAIDGQQIVNLEISEKIDDERLTDIVNLAKSNNPEFFLLFSKTYPTFQEILRERCPDIRTSEMEFCAMASLNFSTKNIAEYTFVTVRAVQIRKNRLRKRLNLPSDIDFNSLMMEIAINRKKKDSP